MGTLMFWHCFLVESERKPKPSLDGVAERLIDIFHMCGHWSGYVFRTYGTGRYIHIFVFLFYLFF
jgi:hypothetical protein